jgi:hypothetical protein
MPAFELINVQIALAGDIRSVVDRTAPENGVTFPEYEILAKIHGIGSMRNPEVSGETVTRTQAEEKDRLMNLYGEEAVTAVYGGSSSQMPVKAPEEMPRADAKPAKKTKAKVEEQPEPEPEAEPEAEEEEPAEDKHGRTKSKIKDLPK